MILRGMTKLVQLRNIGKTTARWLEEIGITTPEDLQRVGAVDAWRRMKSAYPDQVTLVGLYALLLPW